MNRESIYVAALAAFLIIILLVYLYRAMLSEDRLFRTKGHKRTCKRCDAKQVVTGYDSHLRLFYDEVQLGTDPNCRCRAYANILYHS